MKIIGLTGGIGSGKSTFGKFLKACGAKVIEADDLAKKYLTSSAGSKKIVRQFGKDLLSIRGKIRKKKLAQIVFADQQKLLQLEAILHPPVIANIKKEISRFRGAERKRMLVVIVPLLFEKKIERFFDKIMVVRAPKEKRAARASQRLRIKPKEVLRRMACQIKSALQVKKADIVIKNDGSKKELKEKSKKIFNQLMND